MATLEPRSYLELMGDPAKDACVEGVASGDPTPGYGSIFARWRAADVAPAIDQVHRDLLTDFEATVGAIGYFVDNGKSPSGILKVTHGYRVFTGFFPTNTENRGKTFAYVGNVIGGIDINTFELDASQLERTPEVLCARTPEQHLALLQADPAGTTVGPFAPGDPALHNPLVTRKAMFIPFGLVPYVLSQDLTARQAFEILWPVILSKGWRSHTIPLVKFLMVASTLHTVGDPPKTLNAQLGVGGVMTGAADVLSERREKILYQQLPALRPSQTTQAAPVGDPHMVSLVAQIALLNDANRIDRVDRQAVRDKASLPKTVRDKFQDYITQKLLHLTDCYRDEDLPSIYTELAARQKGVSKRMVLQQAYDITSTTLNLNRLPASPAHVLCLDQWDFTGPSMDAVGMGLLPLSIVPPNAPSTKGRKAMMDDAERARQYDLSGEAVSGAISAVDAKRLCNTSGYVPTEWGDADAQLELYGVVLGTILGVNHSVTTTHIRAYRYYDRIRARLQASMNRKFGAALAPALLVFHFQLQYRSWFEERFIYGVVNNPAPDVAAGLSQFIVSNRLDWLPGYEDVPSLAALAVGSTPPPLPTTRGGGGGGGGGTRPTPIVSVGSATGGRTAATPSTITAERSINRNRDPRYSGGGPIALMIQSRPIRDALLLAGTDEPPLVSRGGTKVPPCLSWQLKGVCYTNCNRKADHVTNSEPEKEKLWQWCQLAFAPPST